MQKREPQERENVFCESVLQLSKYLFTFKEFSPFECLEFSQVSFLSRNLVKDRR